ncbi:MAG: magnesium transporter [Candidatus Acidiferrales bacterium]
MTVSPSRAADALTDNYFELFPDETALLLEKLEPEETARILERSPLRRGVPGIERLTPETAAKVLERMNPVAAVQILDALDPSRTAVLLARLDPETRAPLLGGFHPRKVKELNTLMSYPPDTAGSLCDSRPVTFRPETGVREALARIRMLPGRRIEDIYLVDEQGRLTGSIALQDLVRADLKAQLETIASRAPVSVPAMATREELVELLQEHKLSAVAVVDFENHLVGTIHEETLFTAVQEEAAADIQIMVGASADERALSKASFAIRKRLPWLQVNLLTAFLAAFVISLFESTIAKFSVLAVLMPVVAGQSGNTGMQALAVTLRGLAMREIRLRHWLRVELKEAVVGVANGIAVAVTVAACVYLWNRSFGLALVIGVSMVLSMMLAGIAGAAVPMLMTSLGQDPAQSSSIILTTITDCVGFASFLGIATLLSSML